MGLDRLDRDAQHPCDLLVGVTVGKQMHNLQLSRSEVIDCGETDLGASHNSTMAQYSPSAQSDSSRPSHEIYHYGILLASASTAGPSRLAMFE